MAPSTAVVDVSVEGITDTTSVTLLDSIDTNGHVHPKFTIGNVLSHRSKSTPIPHGVAAFSTSDMFKSSGCFKKPNAKRWDHLITPESASRVSSTLKGAAVHLSKPGLISLGGGLPSSDYFPFEHIDVKVPAPPHFEETEVAKTGQVHRAGKYDMSEGKSLYDLSVCLNYGLGTGSAQLLRFVTEHTEIVHNPPYADWNCCLTTGSTSALDMAFRMFCPRGSYLLTEEYSFASAIETARPMGIQVAGIKMDEEGLLPSDLDSVLDNWDEGARGAPKPFLVYTVPTGQNPTGATQSLARRKEIYAVAEKHDLYILEDEPYYFLQMETYIPRSAASSGEEATSHTTSIPDFLDALTPSLLSLDTSGRVLRLDSFSKVVAPGSRCGWVTGSEQIIERIIRHSENSTQNPSGFSQIVLFKLLDEAWGHEGFLQWLMYIRVEYTRRRDNIVRACEKYLPTEVCSWEPPMAGMFHWIKVEWEKHPDYSTANTPTTTTTDNTNGTTTTTTNEAYDCFLRVEDKIFLAAVDKGVLCSKGSWFRAEAGTDTEMFFRTTFAAAPSDRVEEAICRFGEALREEFGIS